MPRDDAPPPRIKTPWKIPARAVQPDGIDTLPAGCRVLRTLHLPRGEVAASEQLDKNGCDWMKCIVGVPWSPEEFIEKARKCLHPKLLTSGLPPELDQVINKNASLCGKSLSMERTATMRKWLGWALECMEAEDKLKNEMSAPRRNILKSKRLCLFERLLGDVGHEDVNIAQEMGEGFKLLGPVPKSNFFQKKRRYATMAVSELKRLAPLTRRGIYNSTVSCGDPEIDEAVYTVTKNELAKGWLSGPHDFEDLPETASLTRRFGVKQGGGKVRPIDNFTESLLNLTSSADETVTLHGAPVLGAMFARWLEVTERMGIADKGLRIKTVDLSGAYKQLCLADEALQDGFICVYDPVRQLPAIFGQVVLPFGSVPSVHGFCRVSSGLWKLCVVGLSIIASVYFDDFVFLSRDAATEHTSAILEMFFRLTGWATNLDKAVEFGLDAKVLGLQVDLSGLSSGLAKLGNTESRRHELDETISEALKKKNLGVHEGQRLRGRLLFAESQVFGRRATVAMGILNHHIHVVQGGRISGDLVWALEMLRDKVVHGRPRVQSGAFVCGCLS